MLEDIETDNCQKIADIILNESVDNNYGIAKDDMSVIVCKLSSVWWGLPGGTFLPGKFFTMGTGYIKIKSLVLSRLKTCP